MAVCLTLAWRSLSAYREKVKGQALLVERIQEEIENSNNNIFVLKFKNDPSSSLN